MGTSFESISPGAWTGKICMVTGATSGLGEATAHELAQMGAEVIVVGRQREKCIATVQRLKEQTKNPSVEFMLADLSSQQEIRKLAGQFKERYQRLNVLVNNAGALFTKRRVSGDGIEMSLALNHLSYFLLTNLLLPALKAGAPSRIVNVAASAHVFARGVNFADLQSRIRYSGWQAYGHSKLCNLLFTYELSRRMEGTNVTVNALHPGIVATRFGHNNQGLMARMIRFSNRFALRPARGAQNIIYLATSPAVAGVSGKYFDQKKEARSSAASYDRAAAEQLWHISETMTGFSE